MVEILEFSLISATFRGKTSGFQLLLADGSLLIQVVVIFTTNGERLAAENGKSLPDNYFCLHIHRKILKIFLDQSKF